MTETEMFNALESETKQKEQLEYDIAGVREELASANEVIKECLDDMEKAHADYLGNSHLEVFETLGLSHCRCFGKLKAHYIWSKGAQDD